MGRKLASFLMASTALTPIALNAKQNFFKDKLPSIVKNIAQGFEDGNEEEAAQNEIVDYSLNAANRALNVSKKTFLLIHHLHILNSPLEVTHVA
jgi:hypothetical protein